MPRRRALLLTLGSIGLAASLSLGLRAAWPSPRQTIRIEIPAATLPAQDGTDTGAPVPELAVGLDLPTEMLRGRPERLVLRVDSPAAGEGLSLSAGIVSASLSIRPRGESGQAFVPGASFHWTLTAAGGTAARATILVRVRRAPATASAAAERLLLARDVDLPVRSAFGLSAAGAAWACGALALAGAGMLAAGSRRAG
jgi:hypothetical protein